MPVLSTLRRNDYCSVHQRSMDNAVVRKSACIRHQRRPILWHRDRRSAGFGEAIGVGMSHTIACGTVVLSLWKTTVSPAFTGTVSGLNCAAAVIWTIVVPGPGAGPPPIPGQGCPDEDRKRRHPRQQPGSDRSYHHHVIQHMAMQVPLSLRILVGRSTSSHKTSRRSINREYKRICWTECACILELRNRVVLDTPLDRPGVVPLGPGNIQR